MQRCSLRTAAGSPGMNDTPPSPSDPSQDQALVTQADLPSWLRILLIFLGLVFFLIGLVMLALPVLPQVWAFGLAALCFSLASHSAWLWLERKLRRWPKIHRTTVRWRARILAALPSN